MDKARHHFKHYKKIFLFKIDQILSLSFLQRVFIILSFHQSSYDIWVVPYREGLK